jgi:hypothetical protein
MKLRIRRAKRYRIHLRDGNEFKITVDKLKGMDRMEDLGADVRIVLKYILNIWWCWCSSVCIMSGYRRDDRVSVPGKGKDFSSNLRVQTSSEAHPASCPMGTGCLFPG